MISAFKRSIFNRRYDISGERGATSIMFVGIIFFLIVVALVLALFLGDAVADRRNGNTASDSAALAGAGYCADKIEANYKEALVAPDGPTFWAHFGRPVSQYCGGAAVEASSYANRNGATLTSYVPLSGLRYRATVRMKDPVEDSSWKLTSKATAQISMSRGTCVKHGLLGVAAEGRCLTSPAARGGNTNRPVINDYKAVVKVKLVDT